MRDLYSASEQPGSDLRRVNDEYLAELASAVTGDLGGKVGVAPRIFLRKLVAEVLDRVDLLPEFDPRVHYALTVSPAELNEVERNAGTAHAGDVELDLP